jgi:uncharacterized membrane protein YeaQ/YmgE (transglycosylase-associated protein family)
MQILWTIILGFLAGAVAKLIMPGKDPGGFIITTILGIAGAVVAKYLGVALGLYDSADSVGFIAAVIGAIILLAIYGFVVKRRARSPLT